MLKEFTSINGVSAGRETVAEFDAHGISSSNGFCRSSREGFTMSSRSLIWR
jgi:hypothetical protein